MIGVPFSRKPVGGEGRYQLSGGRSFQTEGATCASQICRAVKSQCGQRGDEVGEMGGPSQRHKGG